MMKKIARTLLIGATLVGFAYARPSACNGWSLNPFASNDKPKTTIYPTRAAKKPPSAWTKFTTGTKNFFNKTGEKLGLKKPAPKRPPAIVYQNPRVLTSPRKESKSWFSWAKPAEPDRPKTVQAWMSDTQQITP